jgi:predicted nucleotidyltransferase component of viral defense system
VPFAFSLGAGKTKISGSTILYNKAFPGVLAAFCSDQFHVSEPGAFPAYNFMEVCAKQIELLAAVNNIKKAFFM